MKNLFIFLFIIIPLLVSAEDNVKDILGQILKEGSIKGVGLEKSTSNGKMQWTAVKNGASISFISGEHIWDFSQFVNLVCEIQNLSDNELFVECRINGDYWSTGAGYIPAKSTKVIETLILRKNYSDEQLKLFPKMKGLPGGATKLWCSYSPDSIRKFSLYFPLISPNDCFTIKSIKLKKAYKEYSGRDYEALLPFVDEFGQYVHAEYCGKISKIGDIVKADKREVRDLKKYPGNNSWDIYGGWSAGPKLKASGHFRVEKYNGKWWLVDPMGYLFWSHGITCVAGGDGTNIIGRENFYKSLDLPDGVDSTLFITERDGKKEISYWKLNMYRKWGVNFKEKMVNRTISRLKSWNINTIANWSNIDVINTRKIPYTAVIHTQYGHNIQDPFAPDFQKKIERMLDGSSARNDEWCIGYFVDNELKWGNDFHLATMTLQGHYPFAKKAFKNMMMEKYASLAELNSIWGSKFSTWDDWMENDSCYVGAKEDMVNFTKHMANVYFRIIKEALKAKAPNKLYLGCRFNYGDYSGNPQQRWVVDIAARYCDVVSFNRYAYSAYSLRPTENMDFPMIIGEFHFGGMDRGLLHGGLRYGGNQQNRADLYKHYVQDAAQNPWIVGTHWFQYNDQAVTGRGDGENYQIGFINVYDSPNWELVRSARAVGESMYELRNSK